MKYFINHEEVNKDEFEQRLQIEIDNYIPCSKYWAKKEQIRDVLKEKRCFYFPVYDKRCKNSLTILNKNIYIACEDEILDMADIIEQNEYDAYDSDSLQIAVALYNAGYRRVSKDEN